MDTAADYFPDHTPAETEKVRRKARVKIGHDRSRLLHSIEKLENALGVKFPGFTLARLAELTDDEFRALEHRIKGTLSNALAGVDQPAAVPCYRNQIANHRAWAAGKSPYYRWTDDDYERLLATLETLGPGCELYFNLAMSIGCKLPSGRCIQINRDGLESKN